MTGPIAVDVNADRTVTRVAIPPLTYNPTKLADRLAEFGENVIAKVNA